MQEAVQILLALVILYGLEAVLVLEEGALVLLPGPRRFRWRRPLGDLGPRRFGVAWGDLRPWREELVVEDAPVHLTGEALLGYSLRALPPAIRTTVAGGRFGWNEIAGVTRRGRELLLGSRRSVWCSTAAGADHLAGLLVELAALSPGERQRRLERETRDAFDAKAAADDLARLRETSRSLRFASTSTLALWPAVLLLSGWAGLMNSWPWLAGFGVVSDLLLALLFHRAHARLFPRLADERWGTLPMAALFPPAAWRLFAKLSRGAVAHRHPVAVALALADDESALLLVSGYLRDLAYPVQLPGSRDEEATLERISRERTLTVMREALARAGAPADRLLAGRGPRSADARSHCPRCQAEYRHPAGECTSCHGVSLLAR